MGGREGEGGEGVRPGGGEGVRPVEGKGSGRVEGKGSGRVEGRVRGQAGWRDGGGGGGEESMEEGSGQGGRSRGCSPIQGLKGRHLVIYVPTITLFSHVVSLKEIKLHSQ